MQFIKSYWQMIVGLLLFIATIVGIHFHYGWFKLLAPWHTISSISLGAALLLVFLSYLLRTLRFYDYFRQYTHKHFILMLRITTIHNFFNNFLPMRSGELAFPMQMKTHFAIPYRRSGPALFYLRLLDLHVITLIGITLFTLPISIPLMLMLVSGWLALPGLGFYFVESIYDNTHSESQPTAPKQTKWLSVLNSIRDGAPNSITQLYRAWLWTLINWLIKIFAFTYILLQFLPTTIPTAVLGVTSGELSSVLPIHGVAGIGSYEAAVLAGLLPRGISLDEAIQAATNLHIFILGATVALTALTYLFTKTMKVQTPAISKNASSL